MSYEGDDIAVIFRSRPAKLALVRMADAGGDSLHDWVVQNTPIDTGNLRTSWYRRRARKVPGASGDFVYESVVATDVDYAPDVEHGTGLWGPEHKKYLIRPKKPGGSLSWIGPSGTRVFAAQVWHPGSPGQHMMASAAAKVEGTMEHVMRNPLRWWAAEQEALFAEARARRH